MRYINYPFCREQVLLTESRNIEAEEKVLISFKLKYFQPKERRKVKMQKTNEMQRPSKLLKSRRLT